jgi:hypothetical protein
MLDPISLAQQKTKLNEVIKTAQAINNQVILDKSVAALANLKDQIPKPLEIVQAQLDQLPIQPDLELIKKEMEAQVQTVRAEVEQLLQQRKEEEINKLRDRVETLAGPFVPAIGIFLKLPTKDPKILAYTAFAAAKKKIRQLKQQASKENLKKSKEAFTFPMKPPSRLELGQLPKVDPPKIPQIPSINIPTIG